MVDKLKNKVLVSFSTYNSPHFLQHLVESIEKHDAGYLFDLLVVDHSSSNKNQLKLLEKYSKKFKVEVRENHGRAQGSYHYVWQNNQDYKYYFFMHEDSGILSNGWVKLAVDRVEDDYVEPELRNLDEVKILPIGKVGFQSYEWGDKYKYFRTNYPQIFRYMDPIADILEIEIPKYYQHINDDRILYKNELLKKMARIWNIEDFKQMELNNDEKWHKINKWFIDNNLENYDPFPPDRYGQKFHKFQTCIEFLSDIAPMRYGYRTHCVVGDGYCQEEKGFNSFWGNDCVVHYNDHFVFKTLSKMYNIDENTIRRKYREINFLQIVDNIIKNETKKKI